MSNRGVMYVASLAVLSYLSLAGHAQTTSCDVTLSCLSRSKFAHHPGNNETENIIFLAGLFSVHESGVGTACGTTLLPGGYQHSEAFLWAVDSFKQRYPGRFQDVSLGALAFDACTDFGKSTQTALNLETCEIAYGSPSVHPDNVMAYISSMENVMLSSLAQLSADISKPILSSTSGESSQPTKDHMVFNLAPGVATEMEAIAKFIRQWDYVQVLRSDTPASIQMFAELMRFIERTCIVNLLNVTEAVGVDADMNDVLESLLANRQTSVVVVLLERKETIRRLLQTADNQGSAQQNFFWVFPSTWGTDPDIALDIEGLQGRVVTFELKAMNSDFDSHYESLGTGLRRYSNPWLEEFMEYLSTSNSSVRTSTLTHDVGLTVQAVDVALLSIHSAVADRCGQAYSGLCNNFKNFDSKTALINDLLLRVSIDPFQQGALFDDNGQQRQATLGVYQYIGSGKQCGNTCYREVGTYAQSTRTLFSIEPISVTSDCPSDPCAQCGDTTTAPSTTATATSMTTSMGVLPPQARINTEQKGMRDGDWVIAIIILAGLGLLCVIILELYLLYKISETRSQTRSMWLGQVLLLGIFLSYLVLFAYVPTPTTASCGIIRFGVGICYALMFSVLLVKLMVIFSSKNIGYLKGVFQILMLFFAWGVQLAIDVEWLITNPPNAIIDNSTGEYQWVCENGYKSHVITLSYVMFLIVICTCLALRAHGIVSNYRESVYIGVAAGLTIPIFIAWLLVGFLNENKNFEDPCMAFGLLCTATLLLVVIFIPKIHHINKLSEDNFLPDEDTGEYTGNTWVDSTGNGYVHAVIEPEKYMNPVYSNGIAYTAPAPAKPPSVLDAPVLSVDDMDIGFSAEELYKDPEQAPTYRVAYKADPDALYLRHPGSTHASRAGSVRSLPLTYHLQAASRRTPYVIGEARTLPASGKTLRMTQELAGRTPLERKVRSEYNYPTGTARSVISVRSTRSGRSGIKRPRSLQDLGSL